MNTLASFIILIPSLAALISFFVQSSFWVSILNIFTAGLLLIASLYLSSEIFNMSEFSNSGVFIFDPLSAFALRLVAVITFLAFLFSASYLNSLKKQDEIDDKVFHNYYLFANLFVAMMLTLALMNNIAWSWIALEGTTLTSALLLGLYRQARYIEAAWKYVLVCSVGILTALLGIVLFVTSINNGAGIDIFSFFDLMNNKFVLNENLAKIAFALIFVGYGTKIGLAPMHTWLPDTYQNSPSPMSALFTGALSSLALIPLLRFKHIIDLAFVSTSFTSGLFCFFGFISIIFAALFVVDQFDFKRLLGYSSIENLGLIVFAIGLGTHASLIAAFLHIIFHAFAKTVLFFSTGNLFIKYHSHSLNTVRGVYRRLPGTGLALVLGILAIVGLPPFAIFVSKLMILTELINTNLLLAVFILIAFTIIFGSFIFYFNKILFWEAEEGKDLFRQAEISLKPINVIAITIPLCLLAYLGLFLPDIVFNYIEKVIAVLKPF